MNTTIKRVKRAPTSAPQVILTSMIDMFTILLVFLLKSYTATDIAPSADMKLPLSVSDRLPEVALKITISKEKLLLDDKDIVPIENGRIHPALKDKFIIVPLYDALQSHVARRQTMMRDYPELAKKFKEKVLIIADKDTPASLLDEVFLTVSQRDFGKFHLVVQKRPKEEAT